MKTEICDQFGIDFPLFAFSHCRDVVAAVTNAGGFGVLGGVAFRPDQLDQELTWIDEQVKGKPYGVDIIVPAKYEGKGENLSFGQLAERIPEEFHSFVRELLAAHDIDVDDEPRIAPSSLGGDTGQSLLEISLNHPIKLMANALGVPPDYMIKAGKQTGIPVAALVGAKEHAIKQVNAGVDLIVAQGTEAGGHCGEVSTLVLVPEVIRAVRSVREVPVLAAGGIVTGAQMAAMMALGAAGAWTGSVWLMTAESEVSPVLKEKFAAASSRDTVRSRSRTGKPARQLRSAWTDAWEQPGNPGTLPMPLQIFLADPALRRADVEANKGDARARELATYLVGQGVGLLDGVRPVRAVVQEFMEDFAAAAARLEDVVSA